MHRPHPLQTPDEGNSAVFKLFHETSDFLGSGTGWQPPSCSTNGPRAPQLGLQQLAQRPSPRLSNILLNHCWHWPSQCIFGKLISCKHLLDSLILVNPRAQLLPWNYKLGLQNWGPGGGALPTQQVLLAQPHIKGLPFPPALRELIAQRPTWNFLQILKARPRPRWIVFTCGSGFFEAAESSCSGWRSKLSHQERSHCPN